MSTINIKLIFTILLSSSLFICTSADAYDASVSNFNWISPQTLIPQTSEIKYSYRFELTPHSYPYDCSYDVQLYLSRDTVLSSDDFALFSSSDVDLPAGAISFSAETTRFFYSDISLPSAGTYYVFLEITPGSGAPTDTNSSNNSDMDSPPIHVIVDGDPPPPPVDPYPDDGAIEQPLNVLLSWSNVDEATSYDVYFGTDSSPDSTEFMRNQTSTIYSPATLSYDTTYYWRIDSKNASGTTRGDVWSFTTIHVDPPPPFIPIPGRKADVLDPVNQILYTTTDSGTVVRYDVITGYFLNPWTIDGNLGGIDITPDGDKVLIADQSYDTINDIGYVHSVDASSGIVTTLEFLLCEGQQFDGGVLSFDPLNSKIYVSYKDGIGIHPINIVPPPATEDFETGDFSKFPWEDSGETYWTITSQESHSGSYSAKAGSISGNSSTTLHITLDCGSGDIIFYRKVSSESGYDYLKFYIDGEKQGEWSGEQNWDEVSFPVTAGTRTFKWTYSKDSSVSRGADTAWIDDIVFPIAGGASVGAHIEMHSNQYNSMGVSEQSSIHTEFIEIIEE